MRTPHEIVVGVNSPGGGPGLFLKLPIDDALDAVDAIVGSTYTF